MENKLKDLSSNNEIQNLTIPVFESIDQLQEVNLDNFQQITKILEKKFPISVNKRLLSEFVDRLQY